MQSAAVPPLPPDSYRDPSRPKRGDVFHPALREETKGETKAKALSGRVNTEIKP